MPAFAEAHHHDVRRALLLGEERVQGARRVEQRVRFVLGEAPAGRYGAETHAGEIDHQGQVAVRRDGERHRVIVGVVRRARILERGSALRPEAHRVVGDDDERVGVGRLLGDEQERRRHPVLDGAVVESLGAEREAIRLEVEPRRARVAVGLERHRDLVDVVEVVARALEARAGAGAEGAGDELAWRDRVGRRRRRVDVVGRVVARLGERTARQLAVSAARTGEAVDAARAAEDRGHRPDQQEKLHARQG